MQIPGNIGCVSTMFMSDVRMLSCRHGCVWKMTCVFPLVVLARGVDFLFKRKKIIKKKDRMFRVVFVPLQVTEIWAGKPCADWTFALMGGIF